MKELDYLIMSKALAETLERAGDPLTEDQLIVISGTLSVYQLKIEQHGLAALIENLRRSVCRKEDKQR